MKPMPHKDPETRKKYHHEYHKIWYAKNKKRRRELNREYQDTIRKIIAEAKAQGCTVCGYNKCEDALDFHHSSGIKDLEISQFVVSGNKRKLMEELKKCIVVCSNCHREIHSGMM